MESVESADDNVRLTLAYDPLGRVTQVTFPSTLSEGYTYAAMNNLLSKTDCKRVAELGVVCPTLRFVSG